MRIHDDNKNNQKHKGVPKKIKLTVEAYEQRVLPINAIIENPKFTQSEPISYFHMKRTAHKTHIAEVNKVQLASLNDKNYIFNDGILTLPHGHVLLHPIYNMIRDKDPNTIQSTEFIKDLCKLEDNVLLKHERLHYLHLFFKQNSEHLFSNDDGNDDDD